MNIKLLQNMMYSSAKQYVVNKSINFAQDFDNAVKSIYSEYEANNTSEMTLLLTKYFMYIGAIDIVRNNFVDFKYNEDLYKKLDETIKSVSKIERLSETQCYIIACIATDLLATLEDIKNTNSIDIDISIVDPNTFIQSFNNIIDLSDISSILNFIQVNGLQYVYKSQLLLEQEPIMIFKFIYDVINNDNIKKEFSHFALSEAFYKLANSADDEQLKQNCQFLSDEKIEFPVKENSTIVLSKFKEYELELNLNGKTINNVETLLTNIIKDDNFIIDLKQDESNEIKKQLLNAIKEATKNLNAELGFPETIQGDNYSAEQLLNMVLNKRVDKKYIDLIEIIFKEDSIDMFKNTNIYDTETLYEGLYYDFKDVFDNDIKPSIDTGYKMVDDINTFWNAANKLQKTLTNDNIKECFKEFGTVAFHCNDYMIAVKMLFTIFNNVSEDRVYMCLLYVTMVMTDNIIGNVWSSIKKLF